MIALVVILMMGAGLGFVFKKSRLVREEGNATVAALLSLSSIGFAITLFIVMLPMLQWMSQP